MVALPLVTSKLSWSAAWMVIRFVLVAGCVALLTFTVHGIYKDQVEVRNRVIEEAAAKAAAEARAGSLELVVTTLQTRAKERDQELQAARAAVTQLNHDFTDLRRKQQVQLANLSSLLEDLQTKPAPEVEAKANAIMSDINKQLEESLP